MGALLKASTCKYITNLAQQLVKLHRQQKSFALLHGLEDVTVGSLWFVERSGAVVIPVQQAPTLRLFSGGWL